MPRRFDITSCDEGLASGSAVAREHAAHETELLFGFTLRGAHVGADFPFKRRICAAQRGVEAPAGGRHVVLVVRRRRRQMESGYRHGGLANIAVTEPALDAPAKGAGLGRSGNCKTRGIAVGLGCCTDEACTVLLVVEPGTKRNNGAADHGL